MRALVLGLALACLAGAAWAQAAPAAQPPAADDWAADRYFDPKAMAAARRALLQEHGGGIFTLVMANLAEYQSRPHGGGYRWDGEAWIGGDLNRLVLKTEGEGALRGRAEQAEVQALYGRAVSPYFDLQAGLRQDLTPHGRTYATVGVEGLAPYFFMTDAALFLSDRGELLARATASYDLRVTQRLILQPRVEANFAARSVPQNRIGHGLSDAEVGLRLRYEVVRQFAPYVGVSWTRSFGKTADLRRADGETTDATSLVAGVQAWF